MKGFTRIALRLVPGLLMTSMLVTRGPCGAQEVTPPVDGGSGSIFAPSGWVELIAPVHDRVDLKFFGFYIGELEVPVGQIDATVRVAKFLSITPSYMYYTVPASGLNKLSARPASFTDSYNESQFRVDATLTLYVRKLEILGRTMYVRRFRPSPADDLNRYRYRIGLAHPFTVLGSAWKPFAWYEAFDEPKNGGWNRNRLSAGVTLPLMKHVWFQPSYLAESADGTKDVNYLLFGLVINTKH